MMRLLNRVAELAPIPILFLVLTAGWWIDLADLPEKSLCIFRALLRMDCPGCGMTRAFVSIAEGRWIFATRLNVAALPLYFFFAYVLLRQTDRVLLGDRGWLRFSQRAVLIWIGGTLALLLGQWGVKTVGVLAQRLGEAPPDWLHMLNAVGAFFVG